jgi:hypothetical protein
MNEYRAIKKNYKSSKPRLAWFSLNVSVFNNRQVSLLEVRGLKYVSLRTPIF